MISKQAAFALTLILMLGLSNVRMAFGVEARSTVVASGEVRPNRYVKITSNVSGRIQKIYVEPGEEVRRGQALFLIERTSTEVKSLTEYSPLDGVVADIPVRVGETATGDPSGTTLMTIADMSRIYVTVNVVEADISKIAIGQSAAIMVDAFGEESMRGSVIRKDPIPVVESGEKEFRVTLEMREIPKRLRTRLRPGMSATAAIATTVTSPAGSRCRKQSVENMVNAVAEAFTDKMLGILDIDRRYSGAVRIVIEHSLADDDDPQRFEVRRFRSLARLESWLKSREIDGLPGRYSRPPQKCAKGVCTYDLTGGINHRSLYLQKITYGLRNGCPYIKTIYLLDGD